MRRRLAVVLGAAAVIAFAAAVPASAAPRTCADGGRTIRQTDEVRVFTALVGDRADNRRWTFACAIGRPGRVKLHNHWRYSAAGRFVSASGATATKTGDTYGGIELYDTRSLRKVRDIAVGGFGDPRAFGSVVISAQGSLAWIESLYTINLAGFSSHEVHVAPLDGPEQVLDAGPDVDPLSLAVSLRTLYWQRGGQTMTADWR